MTLKVNDRSALMNELAGHWPVVDALMGGTPAMRAAAKRFLPQWPNEDTESYKARLDTATLFPAFERTVGVMGGKPFSKRATFGDDVPEDIVNWCDDCDLEGRNLHTFASDLFLTTLTHGLQGVLVDYPQTGGAMTLAQEKQAGVRPYLVHIGHHQILGWRAEKASNGGMTLTQLRIFETVEEDEGEFGSLRKNRVRVLVPGGYRVYEEGTNGYFQIEEGNTTLNVIPFVPFYGRRVAFMHGRSPLLNLAYLNVKHWQSQSDQDTILHVARVPILFARGFGAEEQLTVGGAAAVKAEQADADLKYVEHSGDAIQAGADSLIALEQQMVQTGAELLVKQPGQRSATESSNDAEANKCELQRITETFEDSLDQCLHLMAMWTKKPSGGHVSLFKDFGALTLSDASAQLILSMQQSGLISKETAIREQQRRGTLSPDIDPEKELEAVENEGPPLSGLNDDLDPVTGLPKPRADVVPA